VLAARQQLLVLVVEAAKAHFIKVVALDLDPDMIRLLY
jgi:hypothetical protein